MVTKISNHNNTNHHYLLFIFINFNEYKKKTYIKKNVLHILFQHTFINKTVLTSHRPSQKNVLCKKTKKTEKNCLTITHKHPHGKFVKPRNIIC